MVLTLDDTKRTAIASKLADMKALQNLLIENEQKLIAAIDDPEISKRLRDFLQDDQKNMGVLDTVIVQYGVKGEPKESMMKVVEQARQMMDSSEFTIFEKVGQHELLKHKQTMAGLLVHKAGQVVGADIEAAIAPLNTVNFENRAHQEQLKGVLEILGVRELTGKDPDQGLWGRVQDAVAALTGVAGSVVTQSTDKQDMNIQDVIRLDHNKVNTLFAEVEATDDPQKLQEYFGQIYKDLTAHSIAEEQVVYPAVRPYYSNTQELYDEQAELKQLLESTRSLSPSSSEFKNQIRRIRDMVMDHVRQEESEMFAKIRDNFSTEQSEQMATRFKQAKSQVQDEMKVSN
ncbi:hemerythrin domain-containing protein [Leptolyngbya sp. FACHB-261]|uniref:hemerythrin domain-containing protein n=1 Tax=Leptolyngbya sp. FACHB-261 TaxID=2692806 RepID=UPI0016872D2E|nr:hemerythrin domain-containing protein [Leptolyngbya sp. FACHB-261]MBD2102918.1 hemerythrin domain-containing protein [Leptolyngbya sp. FACHB-261]